MKYADAETNIFELPQKAKELFTGPSGSSRKEWMNMLTQVQEEGGPAVVSLRNDQSKKR